MRRREGFILFAALIVVFTVAGASPTVEAQQHQGQVLVKAELLADTTAVQPGVPFRVAVRYSIAPEWHIYWTNPGDGGLPTTVTFDLPEGFEVSGPLYPTPLRFTQPGDIEGFGYENEVLLISTITPPATLESDTVAIKARSVWLVCRDVCLPGQAKMDLTLPVGKALRDHDSAEVFARWTRQLPAPGMQLTLAAQRQGEVIFEVPVPDGASDVFWFPPPFEDVVFTVESMQVEGNRAKVKARWQVLGTRPIPTQPALSVLGYGPSEDRAGVGIPIAFQAGPGGQAE